MIVAEDLSKRFGKVVAVDSVNFRIQRGHVVGFLGPNGAGKTTTIRMITGFLSPSGGRVEVDGLDVATDAREVRRRIGYMPESTPLYTEMRVGEYLRFRAKLFGIPRAARAGAVDAAVGRCSLTDVVRRPIGHLSKGYRQRVGLAAALVHEPPTLILDEPTAGLDPSQIREVRALIRELAGRHTVLISTHILTEAELVCDDVIMMSAGRVQAEASIDELRTSAADGTPYIVETDAADAAQVLQGLPSIEAVDAAPLGDGWNRLTIKPTADAEDRRELIYRTLHQKGASVREITREIPSLERLFVELVSGGPKTTRKPEKVE